VTIYLKLFLSFFQIGLLSFGGGYAALPLIKEQVVEQHHWLTMTEFTDLITIAEMTPGPIAINSATFVGTQVGGFPGALVATIGNILPSFVIVIALAYLYNKYRNLKIVQGILNGLRPAVVAMIASAGLSIFILALWGEKGITGLVKDINVVAIIMFSISIFVLRKWKLSPIMIMLGNGIVGVGIYFFTRI